MSDEPTKTSWTATVVGVAIIAVIAAVVAPRGSGPTKAETEAARALRAIAELQAKAHARDGRYWTQDIHCLPGLNAPVAEADASSALGQRPFNGYLFVTMRADGDAFGACAYPKAHPHDGRLTMIVGADGIVWARDVGGVPVVTRPRDPPADGWRKME
jgi:type II secretory pathway pseudopilin PulG